LLARLYQSLFNHLERNSMDLIEISQALLLVVSVILAITFLATTMGTRLERRAERKRNEQRQDRINQF